MTDINFTAVEKSKGFIDILMIYLALGRRSLELAETDS